MKSFLGYCHFETCIMIGWQFCQPIRIHVRKCHQVTREFEEKITNYADPKPGCKLQTVHKISSHPACWMYEGWLETLQTVCRQQQDCRPQTWAKCSQCFESPLMLNAWGVTWNVMNCSPRFAVHKTLILWRLSPCVERHDEAVFVRRQGMWGQPK